jgi:transposase
MNTCVRERAFFVGIDVHKDTHTAVGITPFGEKIFEVKIGNYPHDFESLAARVEQARAKTMLSPYFGLEDCHGYGSRLAMFLAEAGYPVVHVPPILVDNQRKNSTHPEKNDSLDAHGVAEVMIRKIDTLPKYILTEERKIANDLREISMDRELLVKEKTRIKNQLHTSLHRLHNTEYRTLFANPFSQKALKHWLRSYPKDASPFVVRSMKRKVRRLISIQEEIRELEAEMERLLNASGQTIQTASGCGTVTAGAIIGEVGDISRFKSPGSLAKYAGCAPRECSSGKTFRHRKTRAGNRRLNCAFHRMALSQISRMGNPYARAYFARKVSEGKTKLQALVCLRRQMVNIVWSMMKHRTVYHYPQG